MNTETLRIAGPGSQRPWWREAEFGLLIMLVVGAFLLRVGDVSMRGEEPRRARVAFEILDRHDWIVPREQGEPFLSRPPMQNWAIAISTLICGSREPWAVRLPSVLAMLFITILIYGYSRTCLSRLGALAAGAAFVTLGEMFTTGCQAETEAVFIALVSGSLLWWHWGQVAGWSALRKWIGSYVLVGLGVLVKGPQPPVYFVASVGAYIVLTGQWRLLFSWAHVAGAAVGAAIVLAWLIPCYRQEGGPTVFFILMGDTACRLIEWKIGEVSKHMAQFPFEILGSTAPWSLLLLFYLNPNFRRKLGTARPQIVFLGVCLAVTFPTCWIPTTGQTRYFAPMYPCMAVLIGSVVQCCAQADALPAVRLGWRLFLTMIAILMIGAGAAAVGSALFLPNHPQLAPWAEPLLVALIYAIVVGVLAVLAWKGRPGGDTTRVYSAVLALAWFMVITFTGLLTNVRIRKSEDQAGAIARLKEHVFAGRKVVSIGHIDALFAYYYGDLIEARPIPKSASELTDEDLLLCYDTCPGQRLQLPFAWTEVATVSMDRNHRVPPDREVVIVRRVQPASAKLAMSGTAR